MVSGKEKISDFVKWLGAESAVLGLLLAILMAVIAIGGFVIHITNQLAEHEVQIKQLTKQSDTVISEHEIGAAKMDFMLHRLDEISFKLHIQAPVFPQSNSWPTWKQDPDAKKIEPIPLDKKSLANPPPMGLGFMKAPPPPLPQISVR